MHPIYLDLLRKTIDEEDMEFLSTAKTYEFERIFDNLLF
jgi:hypothetical protein